MIAVYCPCHFFAVSIAFRFFFFSKIPKMNIFDLAHLTDSIDSSREFLMQRGVIYDARRCPDRNCRRNMKLEKSDRLAGYIWRCSTCRKNRSLLSGSFFENSHLTLQQIVAVVYFWAHDCTNQQIREFCDIGGDHTVVDYASFMRDICSWKLLQQPIILGGQNQIVQIDESVVARRKYHVGRMVPEKWIFGLYDITTKLGYIQLVPDRSAATLLPIIARVVAPGSIIHSDMWRAYRRIPALGFQHQTVNHSIEFVSAIGVHTQNIERYWNSAKEKIKRLRGSNEYLLPSHLDEFMWRERYAKSHSDTFDNLLLHLSEWKNSH